jgi:hypothetical protein
VDYDGIANIEDIDDATLAIYADALNRAMQQVCGNNSVVPLGTPGPDESNASPRPCPRLRVISRQ